MTYNQDWDRLLNPHRYNADGNLTEAAKQQDVQMQLNSAGGGGKKGGAGDLKVEIPALDKASKKAYEIYGRLSASTKLPDVPNYEAVTSLKNEKFKLGGALDDVITTWDEKSRNLCSAFAKLQNALWCGARDTETVEMDNMTSMGDYMRHYK